MGLFSFTQEIAMDLGPANTISCVKENNPIMNKFLMRQYTSVPITGCPAYNKFLISA